MKSTALSAISCSDTSLAVGPLCVAEKTRFGDFRHLFWRSSSLPMSFFPNQLIRLPETAHSYDSRRGMDLCALSESGAGGPKDSAIDFSLKKGSLEECAQESGAAARTNTSDPMKLWYTVDTDPRTAKKIALESLTYASIDQSVYIMLQVDCPFANKFDYVNIQDLVHTNLRNGMTLMELSDCLRLLAKYAKELLKPSRERYKNWNKIPFLKSGSPQKWTRMEGTAPILHQLGYTQGTSKGYVFPLTSYGPPLALIKVIALELAMSAAELSVFYNNRHPKAEVISAMLYAREVESAAVERDPAPCPPSRPFNVMDLLGSNLKTDRSSDGCEPKFEHTSPSAYDDPANVHHNPQKRRRSYEFTSLGPQTMNFTGSEAAEVPSPTPPNEAAATERDQLIYDSARQFERAHPYGPSPQLHDRCLPSSMEIFPAPSKFPNLAPRYNERTQSEASATNEEVGQRFQVMMPTNLPNLSILGNMLSNTSQKYTNNM